MDNLKELGEEQGNEKERVWYQQLGGGAVLVTLPPPQVQAGIKYDRYLSTSKSSHEPQKKFVCIPFNVISSSRHANTR